MSLSPWISFLFFLFFHFFTFFPLAIIPPLFLRVTSPSSKNFLQKYHSRLFTFRSCYVYCVIENFSKNGENRFRGNTKYEMLFYERDNIKFTSVYGINCFTFFDTVGIMIQNNIRNFFYHWIRVSWFLFFFLFQLIKSIEFYISLVGLFFFLVGKSVEENFQWKISWVYIYGISLRKYDVQRHARIRVRFYCSREVHRQSIYLLLSFRSLPRVFSIDRVSPNNTFKTIQCDRNNKK